jgi:hypothetical protein
MAGNFDRKKIILKEQYYKKENHGGKASHGSRDLCRAFQEGGVIRG